MGNFQRGAVFSNPLLAFFSAIQTLQQMNQLPQSQPQPQPAPNPGLGVPDMRYPEIFRGGVHSGLQPGSPEWFQFWQEQLDQYGNYNLGPSSNPIDIIRQQARNELLGPYAGMSNIPQNIIDANMQISTLLPQARAAPQTATTQPVNPILQTNGAIAATKGTGVGQAPSMMVNAPAPTLRTPFSNPKRNPFALF